MASRIVTAGVAAARIIAVTTSPTGTKGSGVGAVTSRARCREGGAIARGSSVCPAIISIIRVGWPLRRVVAGLKTRVVRVSTASGSVATNAVALASALASLLVTLMVLAATLISAVA